MRKTGIRNVKMHARAHTHTHPERERERNYKIGQMSYICGWPKNLICIDLIVKHRQYNNRASSEPHTVYKSY